jgi:hypothetical protein
MLSEVRFRKTKAVDFLSYVEAGPKRYVHECIHNHI